MMVGRDLQIAARAARRPAGEIVLDGGEPHHRETAGRLLRTAARRSAGHRRTGGRGRSELGAALFGLDRIVSGTLRMQGQSIAPRSPRDAMAGGIGLLPEDRRLQGLMMRMSVLENATLAVLPRISSAGLHPPRAGICAPSLRWRASWR